jgi:hypothetical protein
LLRRRDWPALCPPRTTRVLPALFLKVFHAYAPALAGSVARVAGGDFVPRSASSVFFNITRGPTGVST